MKLIFVLMLMALLPLGAIGNEPHEHNEHEKATEEHGGHEGAETHEEHKGEEEETSSSVGPGKAVLEAEPETGFVLSEKAHAALEIKTLSVRTSGPVLLPPSALVRFKDETGVYRFRDGRFKLIEGASADRQSQVLFSAERSADLKPGDTIVIHGAPLLRVAELDAFSSGEAGHAH